MIAETLRILKEAYFACYHENLKWQYCQRMKMKRDRWVISELISLTNVDRFNRLVSGPLFFQETNKRCSSFNQSEARMRPHWPMREPETVSGSGTIQRCDPQEIQTSEAAWARMWHTKELILLTINILQIRREKKYFCILFLKPILFRDTLLLQLTLRPDKTV